MTQRGKTMTKCIYGHFVTATYVSCNGCGYVLGVYQGTQLNGPFDSATQLFDYVQRCLDNNSKPTGLEKSRAKYLRAN